MKNVISIVALASITAATSAMADTPVTKFELSLDDADDYSCTADSVSNLQSFGTGVSVLDLLIPEWDEAYELRQEAGFDNGGLHLKRAKKTIRTYNRWAKKCNFENQYDVDQIFAFKDNISASISISTAQIALIALCEAADYDARLEVMAAKYDEVVAAYEDADAPDSYITFLNETMGEQLNQATYYGTVCSKHNVAQFDIREAAFNDFHAQQLAQMPTQLVYFETLAELEVVYGDLTDRMEDLRDLYEEAVSLGYDTPYSDSYGIGKLEGIYADATEAYEMQWLQGLENHVSTFDRKVGSWISIYSTYIADHS